MKVFHSPFIYSHVVIISQGLINRYNLRIVFYDLHIIPLEKYRISGSPSLAHSIKSDDPDSAAALLSAAR